MSLDADSFARYCAARLLRHHAYFFRERLVKSAIVGKEFRKLLRRRAHASQTDFVEPLFDFRITHRAGYNALNAALFANVGSLTFAYALGVVKDKADTFTWGFVGISAACVVGVMMAFAPARVRNRALA